ncbi:MAG: hypothetical protein JW834_04215 [Candidatus Diapherotrites archaeon]|nr:hypothetical protein [Candidatus Diapherotrites archaeon]
MSLMSFRNHVEPLNVREARIKALNGLDYGVDRKAHGRVFTDHFKQEWSTKFLMNHQSGEPMINFTNLLQECLHSGPEKKIALRYFVFSHRSRHTPEEMQTMLRLLEDADAYVPLAVGGRG